MFPISEGGMREKVIRWCLIVVFALAAFPAEAQATDRQLDIGEILVLSPEAPVAAVVVGNPEVLDVAVQGDKSVLVFGRASGSSDVVMLNAQHEVVYSERYTVDGGAAEPPAAAAALAPRQHTITVRGPGGQGMTEAEWICDAERRCRQGAADAAAAPGAAE